MQPLFIQPHIEFEKTAAEVDLPEDPNAWAKEVLDELFKQVPYIADFKPHVVMTKVDAERAYGFGHVEISNQSETQMGTDPRMMTAAGIRNVRVPVIIKDGKLSPFDLIVTDNSKVVPLTESRLRQSLFRPQLFDVTSQTPGDQSMIGSLYPPYRQNYGFGGGGVTVPGMGMGKMGMAKQASAFEDYLVEALEAKDPGFRRLKDGGFGEKTAAATAQVAALAKKYQLDPGYAAQVAKDSRGGSADALEHNMAFESALQRGGGGPGVKWDAKKWGGPHPSLGKKTASVLDAILPTINHSDLNRMWDRIGQDYNLQAAMKKNASAILEPLGKLVVPEAPGTEKVAAALPYAIRPSVIQLTKQPTGYLMKTANHNYWRTFTKAIDRGELVERFGEKVAYAVDASGGVTIADGCETAVEKRAEAALSPIVDDGLYKVQSEEGNELVGWVIPNLIDTDGESLPLAMFTNGSQATIQDEIFGEPVGEGAALPSGPPSGYGSFYTVDQDGVRATIPLTLGGSHQMPDQPSVMTGETYDGRPVEVSVQPNIQELTPMEEGRLLVPEHWLWLPLDQAEQVALAGAEGAPEGELPEPAAEAPVEEAPPESTEEVKESMAWISVRSDGQTFSFGGPALSKLASSDTQFLNLDDAMFLLAGLGIEQGYGTTKLAHSMDGARPVRLRIGRLIKTAEEQTKEARERAKALLMVVPNMRKDLLKEAAAIPDPTAVDTVLSLGFINPENLMTFVSYLPTIDDAQAKMCELLLASRIGIKNIPSSALERAVRATEETIEGLKVIAFQS